MMMMLSLNLEMNYQEVQRKDMQWRLDQDREKEESNVEETSL